jgi:UPF0716 protein FxsA
MSFLGRLAFLFIGVPILELLLLIQLGRWMGAWPTVALVLVTGLAGAALVRAEGLRILLAIQGELLRGRLPGEALMDGLAVLVGGALLLTPGILTDLVGLAFLLPPSRRLLKAWIRRGLRRRVESGAIRVAFLSGFPGGSPSRWEPPVRAGEIVVEAGEVESRPPPA